MIPAALIRVLRKYLLRMHPERVASFLRGRKRAAHRGAPRRIAANIRGDDSRWRTIWSNRLVADWRAANPNGGDLTPFNLALKAFYGPYGLHASTRDILTMAMTPSPFWSLMPKDAA